MEDGVISSVQDFGAGSITPDAGGDDVLFRRAAFSEAWTYAIVGRRVSFARDPIQRNKAIRVVGL